MAGRGTTDGTGRRAVVLGGGMAGLLAAQALSPHVQRVTVVERDVYPSETVPRAGVPQSRHLHVLLQSGQEAIEELLPGALDELDGRGAHRVGQPEDQVQMQNGRWYARFPASTRFLACSRPLLDEVVRRRVLADERIEVLEGTQAVGLTGDARRVRGVQVRRVRGGAGKDADGPGADGPGAVRTLDADLVVDASGRSSSAPDWLAELGGERPHEESIELGLAYATRVFRMAEGDPDPDYHCGYFIPGGDSPLTGVLLRIEDGRWIVSLAGTRDAPPPNDGDGFVEFARRYPHPWLHEWLSRAVPEGPVFGNRATGNLRRRFELGGARPAGFVVVGDALCAFNPIYGQGMSVAAMEALALREALGRPDGAPGTRAVQKAVAAVTGAAWALSSGADRNAPGAEVRGVAENRFARPAGWYLGRLQARVPGDRTLGDAYREVLNLRAPLSSLFAPRLAASVLFRAPAATPSAPPLTR